MSKYALEYSIFHPSYSVSTKNDGKSLEVQYSTTKMNFTHFLSVCKDILWLNKIEVT